jgi:hypothetical protein
VFLAAPIGSSGALPNVVIFMAGFTRRGDVSNVRRAVPVSSLTVLSWSATTLFATGSGARNSPVHQSLNNG